MCSFTKKGGSVRGSKETKLYKVKTRIISKDLKFVMAASIQLALRDKEDHHEMELSPKSHAKQQFSTREKTC